MSLAAKSARAAAWNLATGAAVRGLGLVGTLVLTRFVFPQEYGEVAVAGLCAGTAVRLLNFQLGNYVIAHRSPPPEAFQAIILNGGAASLCVAAVLIAREPLGRFLGAPGMTVYLPWLAVATLVTQISHVHSALLMRSMHFRAIAIIRSTGELTFTVLSVALAPRLGAFALVVGHLTRAGLVTTAMVLRAERPEWLRPVWPRLETARRFLAFGVPLSLGTLVDSTAWDKLLVSRFFGASIVGHYNLASSLAQTPGIQVADPIVDVLLPSFSRVESGRRPAALVRTLAIVALLSTPLALGLGAVAPTLVAVVLSQAWQGAGPMITILAGLSLSLPVGWLVGAYLTAEGRTGVQMLLGFLRAALVLALLAAIGWAGPLWACGAVALAHGLSAVAGLFAVRAVSGVPVRDCVGALLPFLGAGGLMVGAVLGIRAFAAGLGLAPGWSLLIAEVGVGAVTYVASALLLARRTVLDLAGIVREAIAQRRRESDSEYGTAG